MMKSVIITTKYKGVFYVEVDESVDLTPKTLTNLSNCKMAIRFGTKRGMMELCDTGPTADSLISSPCDIEVLHGVTGVFAVSPQAEAKWKEA